MKYIKLISVISLLGLITVGMSSSDYVYVRANKNLDKNILYKETGDLSTKGVYAYTLPGTEDAANNLFLARSIEVSNLIPLKPQKDFDDNKHTKRAEEFIQTINNVYMPPGAKDTVWNGNCIDNNQISNGNANWVTKVPENNIKSQREQNAARLQENSDFLLPGANEELCNGACSNGADENSHQPFAPTNSIQRV